MTSRRWTIDPVRYADDEAVQRFVESHPDGATLEEVGEALGVTRERVRQIEDVARRAFLARCALAGIGPEDIARILATRPGRYEEHTLGGLGGPTEQRYERPAVRVEDAPDGLWSERGTRLAAAVAELEARAERAQAAARLLGEVAAALTEDA